ncbi:NAD-binding Rossmann fold oxidoreductase family protein [Fusarium proliferatum]|uniref:NAD-binding Rossmann fold oxidoreductase family protein n=1 Tax=Gibberella intermedia TaxID=948311 RepID=A0A365MR83_GIBIN|nr:NAD-binding Rossmann fold oxidoreductase family protein [Fusarium proliferatum]
MVGIALLGAGIFAREQHLPAIESVGHLSLKAVYSRSEEAAISLAKQAQDMVDIYFDSPPTSGRSLDDLLARSDIAAVAACATILVQPQLIRKALRAGKHVLSEKPIAQDTATAISLVQWYSSQSSPPIWAVAENFRFNESLRYAEMRTREIGGELASFRLSYYGLIRKENKYFKTEWRKTPEFQGGFLLDSGIHFIASLRLLLRAVGQEAKEVMALSSLLKEHLPPVDTVHAIISTTDSRHGAVCISFGVEHKSTLEIEIISTHGVVVWTPVSVQSTIKSDSGESMNETKEFIYNNGVKAEFEAFAQAILQKCPDPRQTPLEALKDLSLLQGLLDSAACNGSMRPAKLE